MEKEKIIGWVFFTVILLLWFFAIFGYQYSWNVILVGVLFIVAVVATLIGMFELLDLYELF